MLRLIGKELADSRHNRTSVKRKKREWKVRGIGSDMKNQSRDWTRTWHGEPKLEALLEIRKGKTVWGRNRWSKSESGGWAQAAGRAQSSRGELWGAAPQGAEQGGMWVERGTTGCACWDILTCRAGSRTELPWGWSSCWLSQQRICLLCCLPLQQHRNDWSRVSLAEAAAAACLGEESRLSGTWMTKILQLGGGSEKATWLREKGSIH